MIRQVRHSFRPEAGAWRGGIATYDVLASPEGLELRPFHHVSAASVTRGIEADPQRPHRIEGAPLKLGTSRLRRGEHLLTSGLPEDRREEDGSLTLAWSRVEERLVNSETGLEQSWAFGSAPPGEGALEVEIPVGSMVFADTTPRGVHFRDPATGLGVRYGHATWIDADGVRTALPVRYASGHLRMEVPEAVLTQSRFPAVLDPVLSPEFGINNPVYGPASRGRHPPVVGSNGTDFLVVWRDARAEAFSMVLGARVSASGVLLDPNGRMLSDPAASSIGEPISVTRLGDDYLLTTVNWNSITFTKVSASSGAVLDRRVASKPYPLVDVASNEAGSLVVWREGSVPSSMHGQRLDAQGAPLGSTFQIASSEVVSPSVASLGGDFLVIWENGQRILGKRVSGDGQLLDAHPITIAESGVQSGSAAIVSNGTDYFVGWAGDDSARTLHFVRLSRSGERHETAASGLLAGGKPRLASVNGEVLVAIDSAFARLAADGSLVAAWAALPEDHGPISGLTVAASEAGYLFSWLSSTPDGIGTWAVRVTAGGTVQEPEPLLLSRSARDQHAPAMASNGTLFLVTWEESRAGHRDLHGTRITHEGVVLDPNGLAISTAGGDQTRAAIASDGVDFFVVWEDARDANKTIRGTRVSAAGTVESPTGLLIGSVSGGGQCSRPSLASDGVSYLVAWSQQNQGAEPDIYGAWVSDGGRSAGRAAPIMQGVNRIHVPAVASNGETFFIAYLSKGTGNGDELRGLLLSRSGTTWSYLWSDLISNPAYGQWDPVATSNGSDYLVAWVVQRTYSVDQIYAARVTSEGESPDRLYGLQISSSLEKDKQQPAVASDGSDYLILWSEKNAGVPGYDVHGRRLTASGGRGPSFRMVTGLSGPQSPAASPTADGRYLVAYRNFVLDPQYNAYRIRATFIEDLEVNRPHASDATALTVRNQPVTLALTAHDPLGSALTYSVVGTPFHGTVGITGNQATFTPEPDFVGDGSFDFVATTAGGDPSNVATVTITVLAQNAAPTITLPPDDLRGSEGASIDFPVEVQDPDGDPVTVTWDFGDGSPIKTGSSTRHIYADDGSYLVTITAEDPVGARTVASLSVHISNLPPVPDPVDDQQVAVGTPFNLKLEATDPGVLDTLSWTLVEGPGTLERNGSFSWTPTTEDLSHTRLIVARVSDDSGADALSTFSIEVVSSSGPGDSEDPPPPGPQNPGAPDPEPTETSGCGCNAGGSLGAALWPGLLGWILWRRRRGPHSPPAASNRDPCGL